MATKGIAHLPPDRALERIGLLIDASQGPRRRGGIARALAWADELEARLPAATDRSELDYFRSNAWTERRQYGRRTSQVWAWESEELQKVIFYLRRARSSEGFAELHPIRRCHILTNLGNSLSTIGRAVEAMEQWRAALAIEPRFWMARGSLGQGLSRYARYLYDDFQAAVLLLQAHRELAKAGQHAEERPEYGFPEALASYQAEAKRIEQSVDLERVSEAFVADGHPLGRSQGERSYRNWSLYNRLFLDPLNDGFVSSVAAVDILMLPSFVAPLSEPPILIGFFNQIKQEFVSARWEYYLATRGGGPHFSDRHVTLSNTLDYPAYGLAVERLRTSYRITYSLLDKVAFFINEYFKIGLDQSAVSFRAIWKEGKPKNLRLRRQFARSKNLPLRALFWLGKDLFDGSLSDVVDPDARALHELRIRLEHRYVKVHELGPLPPEKRGRRKDPFHDTLAYSIGRYDLEQKGLRLLKLARAAIIYLSLAMHQEERRRQRARRSAKLRVGQSLPSIDYKWKR